MAPLPPDFLMGSPLMTLPLRAAFAFALMIAVLTACAHRELEHVAAPTPAPSAVPTPRSFPASRVGTRGIPRLNAMQLREIHAVLAVSTRKQREQLIVSLLDATPSGAMELFYGDPRSPNGVGPGTVSAYHLIGEGCNVYYRPSTGEIFPVPGDGCANWTPSLADRAIRSVP
jgi:hypothetical protein